MIKIIGILIILILLPLTALGIFVLSISFKEFSRRKKLYKRESDKK